MKIIKVTFGETIHKQVKIAQTILREKRNK